MSSAQPPCASVATRVKRLPPALRPTRWSARHVTSLALCRVALPPLSHEACLPQRAVECCRAWLQSLQAVSQHETRRTAALLMRLAALDAAMLTAAARGAPDVLASLRARLCQLPTRSMSRVQTDVCAEWLPTHVRRRLEQGAMVDWHAIALAYALLWRMYDHAGGVSQWWSSLLRMLDVMWIDAHNAPFMFLLPFVLLNECPPPRVLCQLFEVLRCGHDLSVFTALRFVYMLRVPQLSSEQRLALVTSALSFPQRLFDALVQQLSD